MEAERIITYKRVKSIAYENNQIRKMFMSSPIAINILEIELYIAKRYPIYIGSVNGGETYLHDIEKLEIYYNGSYYYAKAFIKTEK